LWEVVELLRMDRMKVVEELVGVMVVVEGVQ
jgi:hypothetical protein